MKSAKNQALKHAVSYGLFASRIDAGLKGICERF